MILKVQELAVELKIAFKGFHMTFHMTFSYVILAVLPPIVSNSSPWVCSTPSPARCVDPAPWTPAESLSLESLLRGVTCKQSDTLNYRHIKEKNRPRGGEGDLEQDEHPNPKLNILIM